MTCRCRKPRRDPATRRFGHAATSSALQGELLRSSRELPRPTRGRLWPIQRATSSASRDSASAAGLTANHQVVSRERGFFQPIVRSRRSVVRGFERTE
jgi:hypothetical protein